MKTSVAFLLLLISFSSFPERVYKKEAGFNLSRAFYGNSYIPESVKRFVKENSHMPAVSAALFGGLSFLGFLGYQGYQWWSDSRVSQRLLSPINPFLQDVDLIIGRQSKNFVSSVSPYFMESTADLENISLKIRPMTIAADYSVFCSNTWLDAKSWLDKSSFMISEKSRHEVLQKTLLLINDKSDKEVAKVWQCLKEKLGTRNNRQNLCLCMDGIIVNETLIREASEHLFYASRNELKLLVEAVTEQPVPIAGDLENYLKEACFLCMKMSLQRPGMSFHVYNQGARVSDDRVEVTFYSVADKPSKAMIDYTSLPELRQGDRPMVKARVHLIHKI